MKSKSVTNCRVSIDPGKLFLIITFLVMVYVSYSCSTTILHKSDLKKDYNFAEKNQIGIYTIPSANQDFNEAYSNALQLYFLTKGYDVKDINLLLGEYSDSIPETKLRKIAEYLKTRDYLNSNDVFVISGFNLDSVFYATTLDEGINKTYHGYYVPQLSTNLAIFDRSIDDAVFSYGAVDTAKLYTPRNKNYRTLIDFQWMVAGRQFVKYLDQIPICSAQRNTEGIKKIKVSFWVDESYRNTFPGEWQERIKRVALFASDIIWNQLGIEMQVSGLVKWDSEFESSLLSAYRELHSKPFSNHDVIRVGVTYDNSLALNVTDRSFLGLGGPMEGVAVLTAQPSFPGMGYWNPIEEAITLAHEISHCFGAMHVIHSNSLMYPYAGKLGYKIDDANKHIVETLVPHYFSEDVSQRTQAYVNTLIELDKNKHRNNLPVLSIIAKHIYEHYYEEATTGSNTNKLNKRIKNMVPDSSYALAVIGVTEFNLSHWDQSIEYLTKAIKLNPDLPEAVWYLSKAYEKVGDKDEAEKCKNSSKLFRNKWIIDNYIMF
jgi:tetratricopeptide (TPR) repeat protein